MCANFAENDEIAEKSGNLRLNSNRCVVMRLGAHIADKKMDLIIALMANCWSLSHPRDLGVLVDSKLRYHNHVRNVVRKVGGLASELLRFTICRTSVSMVSMFVSHIRPIMNFCSNV